MFITEKPIYNKRTFYKTRYDDKANQEPPTKATDLGHAHGFFSRGPVDSPQLPKPVLLSSQTTQLASGAHKEILVPRTSIPHLLLPFSQTAITGIEQGPPPQPRKTVAAPKPQKLGGDPITTMEALVPLPSASSTPPPTRAPQIPKLAVLGTEQPPPPQTRGTVAGPWPEMTKGDPATIDDATTPRSSGRPPTRALQPPRLPVLATEQSPPSQTHGTVAAPRPQM